MSEEGALLRWVDGAIRRHPRITEAFPNPLSIFDDQEFHGESTRTVLLRGKTYDLNIRVGANLVADRDDPSVRFYPVYLNLVREASNQIQVVREVSS